MGEAPAPASTEPERAEPPAGPAASTWQLTSLWDSFFGAPPSDPSESRDETIDDARGPAEDDSGAAVADEVQDENLMVPTELADDDPVDSEEVLSAPADEHCGESLPIGDAPTESEPESIRADATNEVDASEVEVKECETDTHIEPAAAPEEDEDLVTAAAARKDKDQTAQPEAASTSGGEIKPRETETRAESAAAREEDGDPVATAAAHEVQPEAASGVPDCADGREGAPAESEAVQQATSPSAVEEDEAESTGDDGVGPAAPPPQALLSGAPESEASSGSGPEEDRAIMIPEGADPVNDPGPIG